MPKDIELAGPPHIQLLIVDKLNNRQLYYATAQGHLQQLLADLADDCITFGAHLNSTPHLLEALKGVPVFKVEAMVSSLPLIVSSVTPRAARRN